jgi:hypothetical protein
MWNAILTRPLTGKVSDNQGRPLFVVKFGFDVDVVRLVMVLVTSCDVLLVIWTTALCVQEAQDDYETNG